MNTSKTVLSTVFFIAPKKVSSLGVAEVVRVTN